ncbi:MAG TPA: META domain-containing protein [Egicoccus sp.]|nr:META domain-containing protein [Egicoccus sp.]HSK22281.1 META domain-containing protein [Egicoccus sp.]
MRTFLALASLSALALAGCGEVGSEARADLEGVTWVLVEGESRAGSLDGSAARATLLIEPDADEAGGVSFCNHWFGLVEVDGDQIDLDNLGGTEMGCEAPVMDLEAGYLDALAGVDTFTVDDERLTLEGPNERLVFEREPEAPTAELLGTTWTLESVINGQGPDGAVASAMDTAELTLGDGTLTLTSSCLDIEARWVEQGSEYRVTESAFEYADPDAACFHDDPEQQAIASVVDDAFTAEVEGDVLTLHATRSDTGLQFRAAD